MKTPVSTITSTGDLGGEKVAMGFDENSLAHIMSILTDMYSDDQLACIREYSTNALDAHVEAGQTRPIEVITPSALSPFFVVRDFGVGLSVDDIKLVYSQYGASTKRGTDDQVGMLGIGAKSALSMVPQFNVTAVKNGVKIWVSVSRADDGSGHMEIIDTRATDEHNGVEVSIPVPRAGEFGRKAEEFFRFWQPGTVLVNGQEPKHITGRKVGDTFIVQRDLRQDYVVMGNVPYPIKGGFTDGWNQLGIVAYVKIGDVNFTPSREELHYTPKTKRTIADLKAQFAANLQVSAQADVEAATTFTEAWGHATEWRRNFPSQIKTLVYKGQDIPREIAFGKAWKDVDLFAQRSNRVSFWVKGLGADMASEYLFITGFADSMKMSAVQRERTIKWCEQNNVSVTRAAITNTQDFPHSDWTDEFTVVDWAEIAKIKIERAKHAVTRSAPTNPYVLLAGGNSVKSVSTLDTSKDIIYISSAEEKRPDFLRTIYPDAQIVLLSMNRWNKFKRDFPTAQYWKTAVSNSRETMGKNLTDTDKILHFYGNQKYIIAGIDPVRIDDPELRKFIKILKTEAYSDAAKKLNATPSRFGGATVWNGLEVPSNPLTNYPMASNLRFIDIEHVYWYLNSWYANLAFGKESGNINA